MSAIPHPTELRKLLDPERRVERHRDFSCAFYVHCLDEAVHHNWVSWSCAHCLLFRLGPERTLRGEAAATL